jgi:biopolymer transport protein TolR
MAMNLGGSAGAKSDINITPLVDVVLVMLIIFMVATPLTQMGYGVQVPRTATGLPAPAIGQLIVRMDRDGHTFVNREQASSRADFLAKLRQAIAGRSSRVVFFAADGGLPYGQVAEFMDACRENGAENLGIVFEDLKPAPEADEPVAAAPADRL